jgi:hypothetical protein
MLFTQLLGRVISKYPKNETAKYQEDHEEEDVQPGVVLISLKISAFTDPSRWNGRLNSR